MFKKFVAIFFLVIIAAGIINTAAAKETVYGRVLEISSNGKSILDIIDGKRIFADLLKIDTVNLEDGTFTGHNSSGFIFTVYLNDGPEDMTEGDYYTLVYKGSDVYGLYYERPDLL